VLLAALQKSGWYRKEDLRSPIGSFSWTGIIGRPPCGVKVSEGAREDILTAGDV